MCELTQEHARVPVVRHVPPPDPRHLQPDPDAASASEADRERQLREAIATRLERGDTLETVELELIVPSGLPEEQRWALWVYAWSHPKRPPSTAPRPPVWVALTNALLTLIGIYRY
jgi:hypothetical protein